MLLDTKIINVGVAKVHVDLLTEEILEDLIVSPKVAMGAKPKYGIYLQEGSYIRIPFGAISRINGLKQLPQEDSRKLVVNSKSKELKFQGELRSNQIPVVSNILKEYSNTNRILCLAACGTGKTVMGTYISTKIGGGSTLIIVDQSNIATQWETEIKRFIPNARVNVYTSGKKALKDYDPTDHFSIVTAQSLARWPIEEKGPISCNLVIADETHVYAAPVFIQALLKVNFVYALGLTATMDRKDGLAYIFQDFIGNKVIKADAKSMAPTVAVYDYTTPHKQIDFSAFWCAYKVKETGKGMTCYASCKSCIHFSKFPMCPRPYSGLTSNISYSTKIPFLWSVAIDTVCTDPTYLDMLKKIIQKLVAANREIIVFMVLKKPLKILYEWAKELYGIEKVGLYAGKPKLSEMSKQLTFATYALAAKALDVPHKDTAVLGTPSKDIRQTVGRVLRTKDGKKTPLVVDINITNNKLFSGGCLKRVAQYKNMGGEIKWIKTI